MSVNEIVIRMFSAQDIARRYNVPYPTVLTVVDRVNVSRRVGQLITSTDALMSSPNNRRVYGAVQTRN